MYLTFTPRNTTCKPRDKMSTYYHWLKPKSITTKIPPLFKLQLLTNFGAENNINNH